MDLFEQHEILPIEVQAILNRHLDGDNTYEKCASLVAELEAVGYTCEYGLDAEPFGLRKLTEFDTWSVENIDKVFDYYLDDMHPLDSVRVRNEVRTTNEKIIFFIEQEEKYKKQFE